MNPEFEEKISKPFGNPEFEEISKPFGFFLRLFWLFLIGGWGAAMMLYGASDMFLRCPQ